jgi:hypothetical protein
VNTNHFENCSAPLCAEGIDQEEAIWYVGEEICRRDSPFKKKQVKLNKKLKGGHKLNLERAYKIRDLI